MARIHLATTESSDFNELKKGGVDVETVPGATAKATAAENNSRAYIDALLANVSVTDVEFATTANLNLSSPGSTIDGTPSNGDRILVKNQSTGSENGIYVYNGSASAMTRATDLDASAEMKPGLLVKVRKGTANADSWWGLDTDAPITLGTTALVFSAKAGGAAGLALDSQVLKKSGGSQSTSAPTDFTAGVTDNGRALQRQPGFVVYADGFSGTDAQKIQAAVDAVKNGHAGVVALSARDWSIGTPIEVGRDLTIRGAGSGAGGNSQTRLMPSGDNTIFKTNSSTTGSATRVYFEDMTLQGRNATDTSPLVDANAMFITYFKNVYFYKGNRGLRFYPSVAENSTSAIFFTDCIFQYFDDYLLNIDGAYSAHFSNCTYERDFAGTGRTRIVVSTSVATTAARSFNSTSITGGHFEYVDIEVSGHGVNIEGSHFADCSVIFDENSSYCRFKANSTVFSDAIDLGYANEIEGVFKNTAEQGIRSWRTSTNVVNDGGYKGTVGDELVFTSHAWPISADLVATSIGYTNIANSDLYRTDTFDLARDVGDTSVSTHMPKRTMTNFMCLAIPADGGIKVTGANVVKAKRNLLSNGTFGSGAGTTTGWSTSGSPSAVASGTAGYTTLSGTGSHAYYQAVKTVPGRRYMVIAQTLDVNDRVVVGNAWDGAARYAETFEVPLANDANNAYLRVAYFEAKDFTQRISVGNSSTGSTSLRFIAVIDLDDTDLYASAPPASGTWRAGDVIKNISYAADKPAGWRCVTGGTPGTWEELPATPAYYVLIKPSGDTTGATDTARAQAALDAAPVNGGGIVQTTTGQFYFTNLEIPAKTRFIGSDQFASEWNQVNGVSGRAFIREKQSTAGGATGIWVENATLDGQNTATGDGLDLGNGGGPTLNYAAGVRNVLSKNFPAGKAIKLKANTSGTLSGLWGMHSQDGVYIEGGSNKLFDIHGEDNSRYDLFAGGADDDYFGLHLEPGTPTTSTDESLRVEGTANRFRGLTFGLRADRQRLIGIKSGVNRFGFEKVKVNENGHTATDTIYSYGYSASLTTDKYLTNFVDTSGATYPVRIYDSTTNTIKALDSSPADVQVFAANGTWTKPTGAKSVAVTVLGAGGGGGSGRRGAAGSVRCGGGSGGGGAISRAVIPASALGSSVSVSVGSGGAGGAAVTTDDTDGSAGTAGGGSVFGTYVRGSGGSAGGGGTATAGTAGAGASGQTNGTTGGAASASGGTGSSGGSGSGGIGGGAGGGITTGNSASAGGASGTNQGGSGSGGAGGVVDTTAPTAGPAALTNSGLPGGGGGGGAASITTAAQAGAAASIYGCAGGGGGASLNGNNSGAGGAGSAGMVIVTTYF